MMRDDRSDLTDELVVEKGGWHERYARVVLTVVDGDVAVVVVDGNGDGSALEIEAWHRGGHGWEGGGASGFGGGSILGSLWDGGGQWCMAGESVPGGITVVRFRSEDYQCEANHLGFWGFVHSTDELGSDRPGIVRQSDEKSS
jgi:hypothetical protein